MSKCYETSQSTQFLISKFQDYYKYAHTNYKCQNMNMINHIVNKPVQGAD